MRRNWYAFCAIALAVSGCVSVNVGRHVAAADYTRQITRMAVFLPTDDDFGNTFSAQFSSTFKAGLQANLQACSVASLIYQVDGMQLDGPAKAKSAITAFAADTVLSVQHTNRYLINGDDRGETYVLTLDDVSQHRDVWKATIGVGSSARLWVDRTNTGASLAAKAVQQMAMDGVLKSCPPPAKAA